MPTLASVNLAIKYASRLRKIMLAQRLQEVDDGGVASFNRPFKIAIIFYRLSRSEA